VCASESNGLSCFLYNSATIIISITGIRIRNEFFGIRPEAIKVKITYAVIPVIIPGTNCGLTPVFLIIR
jgi:hypothetical protein